MQTNPSAATFPGGESLPQMQARAVDAVRRRDAPSTAAHGAGRRLARRQPRRRDQVDPRRRPRACTSTSSSGIQVDPASISVIRYTEARPYVLASNTHEGDLSWLAPKPGKAKGRPAQRAGDAEVGGGAGPSTACLHRVEPCRSSTSSIRPSASSRAPSASRARARSSCRHAPAPRLVSVALEKQQVAVLAERIDELLDEVMSSRWSRDPDPRRRAGRARGLRAAGAADRRAVPGRHDDAVVGPRRSPAS